MSIRDLKTYKPMDEQAEFVMSFIDDSREKREEMIDIWDQVDQNFLVRPPQDWDYGTADPLSVYPGQRTRRHGAILKDPETFQQVMTMAAKLALPLFPEDGFVAARGVGFEDIPGAAAVAGLIEHQHRLPGQYFESLKWIMQVCLRGTSVQFGTWEYDEEPRTFVSLYEHPLTGEYVRNEQILQAPVWDDPRFKTVDTRRFYPDHSAEMIREMVGAAHEYQITAQFALRQAAEGKFRKQATLDAIERAAEERKREQDRHADTSDEISPDILAYSEFMPLRCFAYYGETPFKAERGEPEDGLHRRYIAVVNGETVVSKPWPRRLPFFECKVVPRPDSFWGICPGEIMKYDQDYLDVLKMMIADAVVKTTHPPFMYDKNANVDLAKLRRFHPRIPIGADRIDAVRELDYNPPMAAAFQMYAGTKQQMRESYGLLGAIQGLGLGTKRFSASEAAMTFQQATDRPELFATVLEREYLPEKGRYVLDLYREMLDPNDPAELTRRIGQDKVPVNLLNIIPEYDIQFVGSRKHSTEGQKVAAFREIAAAGANPLIAQLVPWIPLLRKWFRDLGADDIAAMVGNPELIKLHAALTQIAGPNPQGGNGNATVPRQPPVEAQPAQLLGGEQ